MSDGPPKYVTFQLRFRPDLHKAIKAAAADNNRSLNSEICHRLEMGAFEERLAALEASLMQIVQTQRELVDAATGRPMWSVTTNLSPTGDWVAESNAKTTRYPPGALKFHPDALVPHRLKD